MGGPGDSQNLQQVALGVPFQVFPVVGKGSGRPCISNLSKKKKTLEKKSQLVQNGFQKPGYKSENKAQGQKLGDLGLPRGVGTFGFETQLRLWADTGWWRVLGGPSPTWAGNKLGPPTRSLGQSRPYRHTLLPKGFLTHQGLHSLGIRDPWPEPGGGCRREKGHLLLWVLTLVALISALVF